MAVPPSVRPKGPSVQASLLTKTEICNKHEVHWSNLQESSYKRDIGNLELLKHNLLYSFWGRL